MLTSLIILAVAQVATAHFKIDYPAWRADTLKNQSYSQWNYPCGGVPADTGNRTDWPIEGGSIALDLHHPWTYVFVNLGLGQNVSNFNYSLTPELMNVTGNGSFCVPQVSLAMANLTVKDGDLATIQVVTSGKSGNALYNCADITFRSSATVLSGDSCTNSSGVTAQIIRQSTGSGHSAAPEMRIDMLVLTSVVGLATVVAIFI